MACEGERCSSGARRHDEPAGGHERADKALCGSAVAYRCRSCGRRYAVELSAWRCECGGLFDLDYELAPTAFDPPPALPWSMWRFAAALPLPGGTGAAFELSLGEGATPLVRGPGGTFCKLDFVMPTGSYKDRGAVVLVALAAGLGAERLLADSSGNAGVAIAAYAARAGIRAEVVVPASTSAAKLSQLASFGATVRRVAGERAHAAAAARELADEGDRFYASHVYNPFFHQGTKTVAYELLEQLGDGLPESILVPAGNGTMLIGLSIGFAELVAARRLRRLPRLVAVQAERCAPLAAAAAGSTAGGSTAARSTAGGSTAGASGRPGAWRSTVAEGIAIADPPRLEQMLEAVTRSGGEVVTVGDDAILLARRELAAAGIDVEPTGAAAWAGLGERRSVHGANGSCLVVLSGSGLKAPASR